MKEHAALVVSLVSVALIAGRLLAIARFDVATAATILQVAGTGNAVAGTALSLLPFALLLATWVLAVHVFVDPGLLPLRGWGGSALFGVLAGATLALTALPAVVLTCVIIALCMALGRWSRRSGKTVDVLGSVAGSRLLRVEAVLLVAVLVLTPVVLQRPWLPTQEITLRDGRVVVGYVLGDADGRLALMADRDRSITFLDPDRIAQREICSGPPATSGALSRLPQVSLGESLLGSLLWGSDVPAYPRCARPGDRSPESVVRPNRS